MHGQQHIKKVYTLLLFLILPSHLCSLFPLIPLEPYLKHNVLWSKSAGILGLPWWCNLYCEMVWSWATFNSLAILPGFSVIWARTGILEHSRWNVKLWTLKIVSVEDLEQLKNISHWQHTTWSQSRCRVVTANFVSEVWLLNAETWVNFLVCYKLEVYWC